MVTSWKNPLGNSLPSGNPQTWRYRSPLTWIFPSRSLFLSKNPLPCHLHLQGLSAFPNRSWNLHPDLEVWLLRTVTVIWDVCFVFGNLNGPLGTGATLCWAPVRAGKIASIPFPWVTSFNTPRKTERLVPLGPVWIRGPWSTKRLSCFSEFTGLGIEGSKILCLTLKPKLQTPMFRGRAIQCGIHEPVR